MENESNNHNGQELNAHSQEAVQPNTTGKTLEGTLPQEGSPLHQPAVSDNRILTDGGSYIAGSVTNEGGINQFGGTMGDVTYIDKRRYYSIPTPQPPTSSSRPKNYIGAPRNPLFQPRPGEFEKLERLLFAGGTGPKKLGLVGMGGVGKTELAIQLAYRYEERFPEGVFRLIATGTTLADWQRQFAELAINTEYLLPDDHPPKEENEARRARYFCRYLASHSGALLVLDNVDDPDFMISVLSSLAGGEIACSLLYTSRNERAPAGITPYPVSLLSEEVALRLLLTTSQPTRYLRLLDEVLAGSQSDEAKAARILCQMVYYLPLALVLLQALLTADQETMLVQLVEQLRGRGVLEVVTDERHPGEVPLDACFRLSWEKVGEADTQRLFKLASYFPEAAPIPLWLLGLAAGLGEQSEGFTPLGKAARLLQQLSLVEKLSQKQVRLHPLVREFAQQLIAKEPDKGQTLRTDAGEKLVAVFNDLSLLEERARREGYWDCLGQVRAADLYAEQLGVDKAESLRRLVRWLDRESYLLGNESWWPTRIPGLFYQQLYNRSLEEGYPLPTEETPKRWLRQEGQVGAEDQALLRVFVGHTDKVNSIAFSSDGKRVLTGSFDGTARLWETASGKVLAMLEGHSNRVWSVAFSPDGTKIVTGSEDGTARLWEVTSGKVLATLEGNSSWVRSVAFSPDGSNVLTGSFDGRVQLWGVASGKVLVTLEGHSGAVRSVAFSPDGTKILTGSEDETARLWDVESQQLLTTFSGVGCVAFSPDGSKIMAIDSYGDITWGLLVHIWEVVSGQEMATFPIAEPVPATALAFDFLSAEFSPDGTKVVLAFSDGVTQLLEVVSGQLLSTFVADSATSLAFSADGTKIMTGSWDGRLRLWEVAKGRVLTSLGSHTSQISSVAFSPDGTKLVTGSYDGMRQLWEVANGQALTTFGDHSYLLSSVAFSPDGTRIAVDTGAEVQLWDVASQQVLMTFSDEEWGAFSPDGTKIVTGSHEWRLRLWEVASGREMVTSTSPDSKASCVAFSPDGTKIVTGCEDGIARLWEAASGQEIVTFTGHESDVSCVAFSPDGTKIVTGSWDGTVRFWEAASGKEVSRFVNYYKIGVMSVAFSPDDHLVIICDTHNYVLLFQLNKAEIGSLLGLYVTTYEVGAIYWQNNDHVILALCLHFWKGK